MTATGIVLDVGNTLSKDNGLTRTQRIQKSAVQIGGAIMNFAWGLAASAVFAAGLAATPAGAVAGTIGAIAIIGYGAEATNAWQEMQYKKFGISE